MPASKHVDEAHGVTVTAPAELAARPQWVAWRIEQRDDKPTKVPYNVLTGARASSTDPATWGRFEEAAAFCTREHFDGVGYVLSPDDPYVGIDLDACRDPRSGRIEGWAKAIINRLDSYTEISPSGTGVRIFVRGALPAHGRRKGSKEKPPAIEVYSQARFLTITGQHYMAAPDTIQDRAQELLAWHVEVFGAPPEPRQNGHVARTPVQLADADLLLKARAADNGARFWALWNGDYSAYGSQSEADLALVNHLAFWTGPDGARLDQLFRSSGLMREKWERPGYRDATIDKALTGRTEFYNGPGSSARLTIGSHTVDPETGEVVEESPWRTLGDLVKAAPASDKQIVDGLLWALRTHWVYSGPGAGKTLLWLAILMHVATGRPFHGRPVIQGPVLLIEEDSPDSVIGDYVQMLADIYDFDLDTLPFWINRLRGLRLKDEAGLTTVREMIAKAPEKPKVCLFDACERLVPSERFSSQELDPLSRLFSLNLEDGITNVMIDHTRKPSGNSVEKIDTIDLLYGGRTKSAISDVMMFLSGGIKAQATLMFPKFRGPEPAQVTISFDGGKGFTLKAGKPKLSESERQVMEVLNNSFGQWVNRATIEEQAHMTGRTAQRCLKRLIEMGWIERQGATNTTSYRSSGAAAGMFG